MEYSPIKFKEKMEKYGFNLKKMYGQNFIIDENIINNIIDKSNIDKDTLVIEIGPGCGSLTYKLCKYAKNVICYEIDETLKDFLKDNLSEFDNVQVIYKDFLKADVKNDIKNYLYKKLYVVANLPYYITTPIITKFIEDDIDVSKLVVMVQKEVGDRFKASVGTKEYNSLTIYLNLYFDIKKVLDISKNVFMPKPNVDSIVLEFNKKENIYDIKDKQIFFKLVKDAFTQKRKNLRNNLKNYNLEIIENVLLKHGFSLTSRAEQIPTYVFVEISNALK